MGTMHITLLIADLIPPPGFAMPLAMPALDALLSRSRVTVYPGCVLEEALLAEFGIDENAPIAALTRLADIDESSAEQSSKSWLRADPVHFAISHDNIQLFDSHVINPTAEEMAAIAETLNRYFAEDGLQIHFPDAARGYIEIKSDDVPETTPLWLMGGASVFANLPRISTKTKINWRAKTNEIQMLLHDHPVNQTRAANGLVPINGLWVWGGGLNELSINTDYDHVVAKLALARGLAIAKSLALESLPQSFSSLSSLCAAPIDGKTEQKTLVVLHAATREIRAQSREAWPLEVNAIDADWIAPAVAALNQGHIASLTILIANESANMTIQVRTGGVFERVKKLFSTRRSLKDFA
ncbi:MAG: hypothetical protein WCL29_02260 [Pseudomonadota bacterium]